MSLVAVEVDGNKVTWSSDQYFGDQTANTHIMMLDPKFQCLGSVDGEVAVAGWVGDPDQFYQWVEGGHVKTGQSYEGEDSDILVTLSNRIYAVTPGGNLIQSASYVEFIGCHADIALALYNDGIPMQRVFRLLQGPVIKGYQFEEWYV